MKGAPPPALRMDRSGATGHSEQENGVERPLVRSDRLIPPYSIHPQTLALRPKTIPLLDHVRETRSARAFSNEADRPAKYGLRQMN